MLLFVPFVKYLLIWVTFPFIQHCIDIQLISISNIINSIAVDKGFKPFFHIDIFSRSCLTIFFYVNLNSNLQFKCFTLFFWFEESLNCHIKGYQICQNDFTVTVNSNKHSASNSRVR